MPEPEVMCRIAKSLGGLEGHPNDVWDTQTYIPMYDEEEPTVFFGLYGLPDFYSLWRHRGKKYILWAGSDIRHFRNGYWLEDGGSIKLDSKPLAEWINKNCESWVENEVEQKALKEMGIESQICPSFLGDVEDFEVSYEWSDKPKVYTSVSGDDFKLYGWDKIPALAVANPDIEFHCYGNTINTPYLFYKPEGMLGDVLEESFPATSPPPNVFVHGRVPKEQMNEEIAQMQGALRLVEFDGFSEIIAKSVLMGQWPISLIKYPHMLGVEDLKTLKYKREPNLEGREYYLQTVNKFPWVR